jgi:3-isopropylmalate/(R)-2-methylmalate dehydratase large subunit
VQAKTMFEKIWDHHTILAEEGEDLLYIDYSILHEESHHVFRMLDARSTPVKRPKQAFAFADHYVQTGSRDKGVDGIATPEMRRGVVQLEANSQRHGLYHFGINDRSQGILHIVPPELGITQPGLIMVGIDSHTSTHGAFGSLAFGMGFSEVAHAMATQSLWQRRPQTMQVKVDGELGFGVSAKDIVLTLIATVGAGGGIGHVVEYSGSTIKALSMEARMTVCNMSIEFGARAGMVAPDDVTFNYMEGRPFAPKKENWSKALSYWQKLPSDHGAIFNKLVNIDATTVAPMTTWGTSPAHAAPITGQVPDPNQAPDEATRGEIAAALDYMGLSPGTSLTEIAVDRVFIGSCTNARIEDLRIAASVAKRGQAKVPTWVVPGSQAVKRQAEQEGLDKIFLAAGFEWREPGCSLCTAINGDQLLPGERCASTSNRNFRGRQGPGGRTHLMSPAMAAAAALTGKLTDVRQLGH